MWTSCMTVTGRSSCFGLGEAGAATFPTKDGYDVTQRVEC